MQQETTLATLETLIRYILGDFERTMSPGDIFTYENSAVFTLTEPNVNSIVEVLKNDTPLTSGQFSYDSATNKLTISASLTSGDIIEIQYKYYSNYSTTEINGYSYSAIAHLSVNNYYTFEIENGTIYPDPEPQERNLIALIAATLIYPDNKSYSLPDIRITVPKDLPLHIKIQKIIGIAKRNVHGAFELL